MGNKVLVTGIDGFTGRYMAPALTQCGYEVHGIVGHQALTAGDADEYRHPCDLTDAKKVHAVVHRVRPDSVIHLAGVSSVDHDNVEAIYRTNLVGTRHLLQALSELPARSGAVLLASSANVYGNATEGVMDETTLPAPANDYAVSKLAMEYMARLYRDRLPIIIARPFNYTGVGQSEAFLLPKIVAHIRRRAASIDLGNLHVARDFSDVRTIVEAYLRLLSSSAAVGGTFNVCSGRAYTLEEVLKLTQEISGHDMTVRVNPAFVRPNDVRILLGSRAKLESCVGAFDPFDLRDTLRWMIEA